jgi:hypothetical protein
MPITKIRFCLERLMVAPDSAGQKLAYVYFENEPGRRSAAKLLSKDEARRIAANIAKLPGLLPRRASWETPRKPWYARAMSVSLAVRKLFGRGCAS